MPQEVSTLGSTPTKSKIITAKNQEKLMSIFMLFPDETFTQHELHEQTQIMYPASVHSALMALVKKNKITRHEQETDARKYIVYQLAVGLNGQRDQQTADIADPASQQH